MLDSGSCSPAEKQCGTNIFPPKDAHIKPLQHYFPKVVSNVWYLWYLVVGWRSHLITLMVLKWVAQPRNNAGSTLDSEPFNIRRGPPWRRKWHWVKGQKNGEGYVGRQASHMNECIWMYCMWSINILLYYDVIIYMYTDTDVYMWIYIYICNFSVNDRCRGVYTCIRTYVRTSIHACMHAITLHLHFHRHFNLHSTALHYIAVHCIHRLSVDFGYTQFSGYPYTTVGS